jgi:hypothetical protein
MPQAIALFALVQPRRSPDLVHSFITAHSSAATMSRGGLDSIRAMEHIIAIQQSTAWAAATDSGSRYRKTVAGQMVPLRLERSRGEIPAAVIAELSLCFRL